MIKRYISIAFCICIAGSFIGCNTAFKDHTSLYTLNLHDTGKEIQLPLSFLLDTLEVVRLESKEDAYSKMFRIFVSENYIGTSGYKEPYKLFDRQGRYIGNVGNYGQGPGEYQTIYHSEIDEKNGIIYITTFDTSKILAYDLSGNFLPDQCIPLASHSPKAICYVDRAMERVTVFNLPFKGKQTRLCWIQDLSGTILQEILAQHHALRPDFSNEIESYRNSEAFDFKLSPYVQTKQDTLYHYDTIQNCLTPVFTLNTPIKSDEIYSYLELPSHYLASIKTIKSGANPDTDIADISLILADKANRKSQYVRVLNDYLGNWEVDPMYLTHFIRNGYFVYKMEPAELKQKLQLALENNELSSDMRSLINKLNNEINNNDNNIILIGNLKK